MVTRRAAVFLLWRKIILVLISFGYPFYFLSEHGIEELQNGWCFLDNVQDPKNPTDNCFEDAQFSVADGRFWSNEACNVLKSTPEGNDVLIT